MTEGEFRILTNEELEQTAEITRLADQIDHIRHQRTSTREKLAPIKNKIGTMVESTYQCKYCRNEDVKRRLIHGFHEETLTNARSQTERKCPHCYIAKSYHEISRKPYAESELAYQMRVKRIFMELADGTRKR